MASLTCRAAAAALVIAGVGVAAAPTADAAPTAQVSVSPTTADPGYATTLRLHGSGFQSIKNGFGGLYVFFGVARGTWQPSRGGASGRDYVYVQDSETKNNHGYQRFVAFPGDPTSYAANGGILTADGSWSATLVVPGATFPAKGRDGGITQVDCRTEQCGVITIGAHGVVNPHNETFTPIRFAGAGAPAPRRTSATPPPTRAAAPPAPTATTTTRAATTPAPHRSSPAAPVRASGPAPATTAATPSPAAASASDSNSNSVLLVVLLAVVAVLAGGGGGLWLRRRRGDR